MKISTRWQRHNRQRYVKWSGMEPVQIVSIETDYSESGALIVMLENEYDMRIRVSMNKDDVEKIVKCFRSMGETIT